MTGCRDGKWMPGRCERMPGKASRICLGSRRGKLVSGGSEWREVILEQSSRFGAQRIQPQWGKMAALWYYPAGRGRWGRGAQIH